MTKEEPPYVLITKYMAHCAHNKTCTITECHRYEQGPLNYGLSESLDVTLGSNLEKNKKILNFLKSNDLLLTKYYNIPIIIIL